jgi:hypothetical protein
MLDLWVFDNDKNKNRLNRVMLPEKVLDTGKYKKKWTKGNNS